MVEIKVLGPITAFHDGKLVDLGGPTQRRLLASLVARSGEVVSVRSLLEHLWGDDPPPSGPASIHSYVSRLRRALGAEVIETRAPGYRLQPEGLSIDSLEFLSATNALPDEPTDRLAAIATALGLWNGPPFEEFSHVEFEARRLTETRFDLQEEQARLLVALARGHEAVPVLERVTSDDPLRETAWVDLGRTLSRLGRQVEAVRTLDRYRKLLADIGLEPGSDFDAAEGEVFEERAAAPARPRPVLEVASSFVGRSSEVSELEKHLNVSRLVSVVGPGGMGKTRLIVEVARVRTHDEVVMVRLETLRDHEEVAPAVLNALGGETRGDPTESVIARLSRTSPTLVIFDNVEHVIESVATLITEILGTTNASVLLTSREPLNMPGEAVLTLGPLDPGSAIELYQERARAVSPGFEAAPSTLDILCEELDYMPLAIEMAASRSRALTPAEILARVSREHGLFDRPLRDGSERHRSLDAMVDWSYRLLDEGAQRVFERLSVVVGSFDADLATAVCGFGAVPPHHVAAFLADLVERSLVDRTGSGEFRVLRVLKSFATGRLEEGPDEEETRRRHARWFAGLAIRIGEGLSSADEMIWIERANASVEDLALALQWSADHHELDVARDILEGLFDWFYHRHPPAITGWADRVMEVTQGHEAYAAASAWAALAAVKRHDMDNAGDIARAGTTVEGPAGRYAWFMTGDVACHIGELEDALDAFRRQMIRASQVDDRIGILDALAAETLVLAYEGEFDRAMEVARDLERVATDVPAPTYGAYTQYIIGEAVIDADPERAAHLFEDAAELAASVNNHYIQALARTSLGSVLARLNRLDEATDHLRAAIGLWVTLGVPSYQWAAIQFLGAVAAQSGCRETAARLLAAAESAGRGPLTAGQAHWAPVVEALRTTDGHDDWTAEGSMLDLEEATNLALQTATDRPSFSGL